MKLNLAAKKAIVEKLTSVASRAVSAVVADYSGIDANKMTQLRNEARKNGIHLQVVRNTLTRRAFKNTDFECLENLLKGPLFIALSINSPGDAARLVKGFSKTLESLEVKALSIGGKLYDAAQLDAIASLPTRDEALAKLLYVMKAPVEKFARTLAAPQVKLARLLAAVRDQKAAV